MRTNSAGTSIRGTGLWFLKKEEAGIAYGILPLASDDYTSNDAFLPLGRSAWPSRNGALAQLVLDAVVNWYCGLEKPTYIDDQRLFNEVAAASRDAAIEIVRNFTASPSARQNAIGRAIAIQLNLDGAVAPLISELQRIQYDPAFDHVIDALSRNYVANDQRSLTTWSHSRLPDRIFHVWMMQLLRHWLAEGPKMCCLPWQYC
jgi:hypothetical protein